MYGKLYFHWVQYNTLKYYNWFMLVARINAWCTTIIWLVIIKLR